MLQVYLSLFICDFFLISLYISLISLPQVSKGDQKQVPQSSSGRPGDTAIKVNIPEIVSVSACGDLTLPPGAGLCIDTIHGPVYLVTVTFCYLVKLNPSQIQNPYRLLLVMITLNRGDICVRVPTEQCRSLFHISTSSPINKLIQCCSFLVKLFLYQE